MPVYVYKNLETGETFEYQQRISEPALTAHPETGQPVRRVIQPVGIAFKGSGFYVNDSRSSNGASSSSSSSKGVGGGDGSADGSGKDVASSASSDASASSSASAAGTGASAPAASSSS